MTLLAYLLLGAVAVALVAAVRMVSEPGRDPAADPVMLSAVGLTLMAELAAVVLAVRVV